MWKLGLVRRVRGEKSFFLLVLSMLLLLPSDLVGAEQALGVSPGRVDRPSEIGSTCPTFSWGAVVGAKSYRLVAYEMTQGAADRGKPILTQELPGTALSWTPNLEDCLARGKTYIWFVRAEGRAAPADWSIGRLFRTPAALGRPELAAALHEYLQSGGTLQELVAAATSGLAAPDLAAASRAQMLPATFAAAEDATPGGLAATDLEGEEFAGEALPSGLLSNLGGGLVSTTGGVNSAAVSGTNIQVGSETNRGYLGVQGSVGFDGMDFLGNEIAGDEIGVLGVSQGGSDNFGVVGVGSGTSSAAGRFFNDTAGSEVLLGTADDGLVCDECIHSGDLPRSSSSRSSAAPNVPTGPSAVSAATFMSPLPWTARLSKPLAEERAAPPPQTTSVNAGASPVSTP